MNVESILAQFERGEIDEDETLRRLAAIDEPPTETAKKTSTAEHAVDVLTQRLTATAATVLGLEVSRLDLDRDLSEYGFDSITLSQWASLIADEFPEIEAQPSVFLEHTTITALAAHWGQRIKAPTIDESLERGDTVRKQAQMEPNIAVAPGEDVRTKLVAELRRIVSNLLALSADRISPDEDLSTYGFDSITLSQFAERIHEKYPFVIPEPAIFLEHATLSALGDHLLSRHADSFRSSAIDPPIVHNEPKESVVSALDDNSPIEPTASRERYSPDDNTEQSPEPSRSSTTTDIAVIGVGGRFPQGRDLAGWWQALTDGQSLICEVPDDRWDWRAIYGDSTTEPGKTDCRFGGFLLDADRFDARLFGIAPREAEQMDPQQRIVMETAWETIENAGYNHEDLRDLPIGVFLGVQRNEHLLVVLQDASALDPYVNTGNTHSMMANRVSRFFGWLGPSMAIDTACSSSAVALHQACQTLRSGECELALACGVTMVLSPYSFVTNRKMGLLCASDRVRSFDKDADGHVIGEGAASVLLKPLQQAQADGDHIYGVIKGTSVVQSGRTLFLTAPDKQGHISAINAALAMANWNADDLDYVEAQGTANELADRTELRAYAEVFANRSAPSPLAISSIKGNVGHMESAAGVAGLIKVLLAMQNNCVPGLLHFETLNWEASVADLPFEIISKTRAWMPRPGLDVPRRAGVHNFGYGGSNAHILVEEYCAQRHDPTPSSSEVLILLSAQSAEQLNRHAKRLHDYLDNEQAALRHKWSLDDIAYTLRTGRQQMEERLAVVVNTIGELNEVLARYTEGLECTRTWRGRATRPPAQPLVADASASLDQVAESWVKGGALPDALKAHDRRAHRIPLPTYPFDDVRFGLPTQPIAAAERNAPTNTLVDLNGPWLHGSVDENATLAAAQMTNETLERRTQQQLLVAFQRMGVFLQESEHYVRVDLEDRLRIAPGQRRLFDALLEILHGSGALRVTADKIETQCRAKGQVNGIEQAVLSTPSTAARQKLLDVCIAALPAVLRDEVRATDVLFPKGCMTLVEDIYRDHAVADYFNQRVADTVVAYVQQHPNRPLSILEVGAGTGATTAAVLPAIAPFKNRLSYTYTDISNGFIQLGRTRFGAHHDSMQFRTLDLEKEPTAQGYALGSFDLIIATNVLHATRRIERTLTHLRKLMVPGGCLVANEATRVSDFLTVTFGLLDGWWLYEDDYRLAGSPLLAAETWQSVLPNFGFENTVMSSGQSSWDCPGQHLIAAIATSGESNVQPSTTQADDGTDEAAINELADGLSGANITRLRNLLADAIHTHPSQLDEDRPFFDYGIDSFLSVELVNSINAEMNASLKKTDLFNYPTLRQLAAHLGRILAEQPMAPVSGQPNAASPTAEATINDDREANQSSEHQSLDIAVTGMSARFPGANNIDEFWALLNAGVDAVGEIPTDRWDADAYFDTDRRVNGKSTGKWGGFLSDIYRFDPLFFNIAPNEATLMDPQQRVFLEQSWCALEDAGYAPESLSGSRCSVFVGCREGDYFNDRSSFEPSAYSGMGGHNAILAARIAYLLNLKGPSIAIDTACSSSLVAIHLACESLRNGSCDLSLAGGVALMTKPETHVVLSKTGMLAADGKCKPFDQRADGFVPAEGVGVVVLKPLRQAQIDGDHIYGVIKGSGVNQDGKTSGITASSAPSQAALQKEVQKRFSIPPESIGYVEAHGTGTSLGDPIEIEGLTRSFGDTARQSCAIGSVKSNIGHALAAAGVAGLIKSLLCLRHKTIVPSLHYQRHNEQIDFENTPFYVPVEPRIWDAPCVGNSVRRAAVNSFGFSGTNAHLIVEEAPTNPDRTKDSRPMHLLVFSAKTRSALQRQLDQFACWLETAAESSIGDIAFTLCRGRGHFEFRSAFVAADIAELRMGLGEASRATPMQPESASESGSPQAPEMQAELAEFLLKEIAAQPLSPNRYRDKLTALGQLYVNGSTIAFDQLYQDGKFRRLPLPGYRFGGTQYRLATPGSNHRGDAHSAPTEPSSVSASHPFIDWKNDDDSGVDGVTFGKHLTAKDPAVRDHQVMGRQIFPGVAHLEMAAAAFVRVTQTNPQFFTSVVWLRPLAVDDDLSEVQIKVDPGRADCRFEISSGRGDDRIVNSRGRINLNAGGLHQPLALDNPFGDHLDINGIESRCGERVQQDLVYQRLRDAGVWHGPSMQGVAWVTGNATEALARLEIPDDTPNEVSYQFLHPCLLDAALQAIAGLGEAFYRGDGALMVPYAVEQLQLIRPLPRIGFAYVRVLKRGRYDVAISDDEGSLCLLMKEVSARALQDPLKAFFYKPRWVDAKTVNSPPLRSKTALFVYPSQPSPIEAPLQQGVENPLILRVGPAGSAADRQNHLDSMIKQIEQWDRDNQLFPAGDDDPLLVFFLGGMQLSCADDELAFLTEMEAHGVSTLLRLVQSLVCTPRSNNPVHLTVVTNRVCAIEPLETDPQVDSRPVVYPHAAALHGFGQSFSAEYPRAKVVLVDLDLGQDSTAEEFIDAAHAVLEQGPLTRTPVIAIRDGRRLMQSLYPISLNRGAAPNIRKGGHYLIIGGAGGLGFQFSRFLAETASVKLCWVGRRSADAAINDHISRLRGTGTQVDYYSGDVSDSQRMNEIVALATEKNGAFNGAVHSAIVLEDQSVANMGDATLRRVLAPKTHGTVILHQVLRSHTLDFLLFFSAGQSFSGHPGQSNYAAASTFEDAYARYLRLQSGQNVKIINWGYWGDVGVVGNAYYQQKQAAKGVSPIQAHEGVEAMRRVLASPHSQLLAAKADLVMLEQLGVDLETLATGVELGQEELAELEQFDASYRLLEAQLPAQLFGVFQSLGLFSDVGDVREIGEIEAHLSLSDTSRKLFRPLLQLLCDEGLISIDGEKVEVLTTKTGVRSGDWESRSEAALAHFELADICLKQYARVLKGQCAATEVLFPGGSTHLVENIYANNPASDFYNRLVARQVRKFVEDRLLSLSPGEKIRILELGAGTGATTQVVMDALSSHHEQLSYFYTDLAPTFLKHGKARFPFECMRFELLNIEQSIETQGFTRGCFDLVIAANVLHATRDLNRTLANSSSLLSDQGRLVLNEATEVRSFATLTFGLLDGYWLHEDAAIRLTGSPLLNLQGWTASLAKQHFDIKEIENMAGERPLGPGQHVITAKLSKTTPASKRSQPTPLTKMAVDEPSIRDDTSAPTRTAEQFELVASLRQKIHQVLGVTAEQIGTDRAFSEYGLDSISSLDLIEKINEELGVILKTTVLFDYPSIADLSRYLLDNHSEAVSRAGLGASSYRQNESESTVACSPAVQATEHRHSTAIGSPGESLPVEPSFTAEHSAAPICDKTNNEHRAHGVAANQCHALLLRRPCKLSDIEVATVDICEPAEGEIQIQVKAAALNFGDLLCVNGLYPNMPEYPFTPGSEVSGVVTKVGKGVVDLAPGDPVVALTMCGLGGHSTVVNCSRDFVVSKPSSISFEKACALPIVFLTMHHAFQLAQVQAGERVLIQTAAGGTGLVAVQMAQDIGAKVYATAGSQKKLDYLASLGVSHLINYREFDFAETALEMTNGYGVDVVINTLSGSAAQKGLDLLAPNGRYIEIAMAALRSSEPLDLSRLVDNQTIHTVDMSRLRQTRPQLFSKYLSELENVMVRQSIEATISHRFPFRQIDEAYRRLEQRDNIGKVVVTMDEPTVEAVRPDQPFTQSESTKRSFQDVAVIGLAGQFPGAQDLDQFWSNLAQGRSAIKEVPPERWDINAHYDPDSARLDKTHCRFGGFVDDIDLFDPAFFNLSGTEVEQTDPQQRLFLKTCWRALEEAGYAVKKDALNCGVFVGGCQGDYFANMEEHDVIPGVQSYWGNAGSVLAARISYLLDLRGPSIAIDTACSSSLVAVHMACQSIVNGDCDLAIAGGAFICTTPRFFVSSSNAGMLATDGNCKVFDQAADGFVPGEGVGALVLKPLDKALEDGDCISAVIKGSAINQDGKTNGITAPSSRAQTEVALAAYDRAGVAPDSLDFIEAHGTGTPLGDPVELAALDAAFRTRTNKVNFCAIGSVKPNIGHAATAAGIAGLIKIILALKHRVIPPTLNHQTPNERFDFASSPFFVNTEAIPWPTMPGRQRRAAISSFGFSGTNSHVVVEQAPDLGRSIRPQRPAYLFTLSAKTELALEQKVADLRLWLSGNDVELADLCFTLHMARQHFPVRLAFVVGDLTQLRKKLDVMMDFDPSTHGVVNLDLQRSVPEEDLEHAALRAIEHLESAHLSSSQWHSVLSRLGTAFCAGLDLEWARIYSKGAYRRLPLPTHPFNETAFGLPPQEHGATSRPTPAIASTNGALQCLLFEPKWVDKPESGDAQHVENSVRSAETSLLVFGSCRQELDRLQSDRSLGCTLITVLLGDDYEELGQGRFEIDPRQDSNLERLFKTLARRSVQLAAMVHTGSEMQDLTLEAQLNDGPDFVLALHRVLTSSHAKLGSALANLNLTYLVRHGSLGPNPLHSAIVGMFRSLRLEQPLRQWKGMHVPEDCPLPTLLRDIHATRGCDPELEISHVNSTVQIKRLSQIPVASISEQPDPHSCLRTGGVYLIVGGTRGVGLVIAKYLAEKLSARLLLLGRSSMSPEIASTLDLLRRLGGDVDYFPTDVSDPVAVDAIFSDERVRQTTINGIFQCAGVLRDGLALQKTHEQMRQVFAPKIAGTIELDRVSSDQPLDFMVLFSSLASITGSVGQADYAFANAFLDQFATQREHLRAQGQRSGITLSINWPLWEDGGMRPSDELTQTLAGKGELVAMPSPVALAALWNALELAKNSRVSQLAIVHGVAEYAAKFLYRSCHPPERLEGMDQVALDCTDAPSTATVSTTLGWLRRTVSDLIKLPVEQVLPTSGYDDFGMDSLMVVQFNKVLGQHLSTFSKTLLYEFPTLAELAAHLVAEHGNELVSISALPAASQASPKAKAVQSDSATELTRNAVLGESSAEEGSTQRSAEKEVGPIAIIGVSGRYPGADTLEAFWENLEAGNDSVVEIPPDRWDVDAYFDKDPAAASEGKSYCRWGGFLSDVGDFDPEFFNISRREAHAMDPQERIFLQTAWSAMEDAGYPPGPLRSRLGPARAISAGVFVGITTQSYPLLAIEQWHETGQAISISAPWSIANRVSFTFNLRGPSMPVDTACSSSLTAVHLACQSIQRGECEMALAGGVNLYLHPLKYAGMCQTGMLSPTGHCHTFGPGDGFVPGEGVGAILLKPLDQARADGDSIYAVIKGSAINHGGKTAGYTVPSPTAQAELIASALAVANVPARSISYVEAHGTGTELGDPIELAGLAKCYATSEKDRGFCAIGSVKPNVGHGEAVAGITGLTKVLLQMKHRRLAPSIYSQPTNPNLNLENSPFFIPQQSERWLPGDKGNHPRRAAISSFGAGGANAHLIVEEDCPSNIAQASSSVPITTRKEVILLSAMSQEQLRAAAAELANFLERPMDEGQVSTPDTAELKTLLADVINVGIGELDTDVQLSEFGLSHFEWIQFSDALNRAFNLDMKPDELSRYASLDDLSRDIHPGARPSDSSLPTLGDIAYTLQVGRSALEQRMAVEVSDKLELINALRRFSNGDQTGVMLGSLSGLDCPPASNQDAIERLLANGQTRQLAEAWVKGAQVDWSQGQRQGRRRVSLPTYPFARKHCWMGEKRLGATTEAGKKEKDPTVSSGTMDRIFYRPAWQNTPRSSDSELLPSRDGHSVLVLSSPATRELAKYLAMQHSNAIVFDESSGQSLREAVDKAAPLEGVYDLRGVATRQAVVEQFAVVAEACAFGLFQLIRALLESGYSEKRLFLRILTSDVFAIGENSLVNPTGACLHGIAKSAAKEIRGWQLSCIDSTVEDLQSNSEQIAHDLAREQAAWRLPDVAYRAGRRLVRTLVPLVLPERNEPPPCLRERGVYVLAGGAGGIGLVVARYLAAKCRARLVLIGRSLDANPVSPEQVAVIEQTGGELLCIGADITDRQALRSAVRRAKRRFGDIHGVFQCAMVFREVELADMTDEDLSQSLAPKVAGSVELHLATANERLDFFAFLSSAQTFTGNAERAAYAAACHFKDAFADHLRNLGQFPVKTINWGFFDAGSMPHQQVKIDLPAQGVQPITPDVGTEALDRVLGHRVDQTAVLLVDDHVLDMMGVDSTQQFYPLPEPSDPWAAQDANHEPKVVPAEFKEVQDAFVELDDFGRSLAFHLLNQARETATCPLEEQSPDVHGTVSPAFDRLLEAMRLIAKPEGQISPMVDWHSAEAAKDQLLAASPHLQPHLELLMTCASQFQQVIRNQVPATDIMFPAGSPSLVERIYRNNAVVNHFNDLMAEAVRNRVQQLADAQSGRVRILEIGAGTGGSSETIMAAIDPWRRRVEYHFTDISARFVNLGQKMFGDRFDYSVYRTLDIEDYPEERDVGGYDLVIAANVLHATVDLERTLTNVKGLLRTGGQLVLNEATGVHSFGLLTFGLLKGWWLFEDNHNRMHGSPLVDCHNWQALLLEQGFHSLSVLGPAEQPASCRQHVICATSDGIIKRPVAKDVSASTPDSTSVEGRSTEHPNADSLSDIEQAVTEVLATVLMTDGALAHDHPFVELGVDSILAVEIIQMINQRLGIALRSTDLFNFVNIRQLCDHIAEHCERLPTSPKPTHIPPHLALRADRGNPERSMDQLLKEQLAALARGQITADETLKVLPGFFAEKAGRETPK